MTPALLARLQATRASNTPFTLATDLASGAQLLLPGDDAPSALIEPAAKALRLDRNVTVEVDGNTWFLHAYNPAMRLVVVGAVHIAQALVPMAIQLGYAVLITDPRRAFATDERFPGLTVSTDWPDEALDAWQPDSRTAIVTLTHDPKLDDPALDRALKSPAFYIGALGSRKTHAARLTRLEALGHDPATLTRIKGPAGLDIGAITAGEIALSILAQLVETRRLPPLPAGEGRAESQPTKNKP